MDKCWMDKRRDSMEYVQGVVKFVEFASLTARDGKILCPCNHCVNMKLLLPNVARDHCWTWGMLKNYKLWKFHGELAAATKATECGSTHVQENLNQYGDFRGMLHDLYPTHEMAPEPTEQGESVQHNRLKSKSIEAAVKRVVVYEKVYNAKDGTHVTVRARENIARMKEILNEEGTPLQGESSGGILWSKDDAFARVMDPERSGRVRGVGFGQTPSNEMTQRIMQLETMFASMKEQLAQLDARHEEQLAQLKARHQEQLAQSLAQLEVRQQEKLAQSLTQLEARQQEQLAQLNARLQEQLAQLDARLQEQMREVMSQMREMLSQFSPHMRSSHLFQNDDDFED